MFHKVGIILVASVSLLALIGCASVANDSDQVVKHATKKTGEFVPGIAVNDATKISDPNKNIFFVAVVPAGSNIGENVAILTKRFLDAAKAKADLAVIGQDADLTARVLLMTLQVAANGSLNGATILYVGDTKYAEAIKAAALPSGAIVRTTRYSGK